MNMVIKGLFCKEDAKRDILVLQRQGAAGNGNVTFNGT